MHPPGTNIQERQSPLFDVYPTLNQDINTFKNDYEKQDKSSPIFNEIRFMRSTYEFIIVLN
jgi:hypothetical protein